jgi:tRNA(Ile)-lysidine synthase
MRIAVAVSGGADSVALLRALIFAAPEIGLVLSFAHVHHGLRGAAADADAAFVAALAAEHGLILHRRDVDTPAAASANHESIEEAARNLRYQFFRELLASGQADAVATAHTLNDQAETVLHKLLRGAWTEGLGGIHPRVLINEVSNTGTGRSEPRSVILRPFLNVRRSEIEAWLRSLDQPWREDATNADTAFTRNRIRHELLPTLAGYNPQIHTQLANLATIARDEDAYWQTELARILPQLLMPGKPVRGGGRSASTDPDESSLAIEIERLPISPAVRRRILRAAARQLGAALNFEQTERLLAMCGPISGTASGPRPSRRQSLTAALHAERSPRELRLIRRSPAAPFAPKADS